MITGPEINSLAGKLKIYDVMQGGWEQEDRSFIANATHVLTHLSKDIVDKDFGDPSLVESAIAPDALMYAIRLGRWTRQEADVLLPTVETYARVDELADRLSLSSLPTNRLSFMEATATVARHLHDTGHSNSRELVKEERESMAQSAGGFLVQCANLQAEQYDINLVEAFDARLSSLRERFGIPELPAPEQG